MELLSQPDLMLYKFVDNSVRVHGHENQVLNLFLLGVELDKDAVCFFGQLYWWLVMLSEYTIDP